ncbi:hypothetical protein EV2_043761 [Malus domestica]
MGFSVKAGVRNLEKAKASLPSDNPALQIVMADVADGSTKLAEVISDDSEVVICATGFSYRWDVFAPWKSSAEKKKLRPWSLHVHSSLHIHLPHDDPGLPLPLTNWLTNCRSINRR